jgi:GT2 family glycosyltransferase/exo-beta-1,3-glucanase (GH17 family)
MPVASPHSYAAKTTLAGRIVAAGKFLRLADGGSFFLRGVSYGPFRPNPRGEPFPEDERLAADLRHIIALGFNTLRIYDLPTQAVLHAAEASGLRLIVGIPWAEHVDFLADRTLQRDIEKRVADAAGRLGAHPCIAAFLVGNEIEKTLVRWMGPERVRDFIEKLIRIARNNAPDTLISYATYPSTEYLVPRNADFLAVNVYLESPVTFNACLSRLQNLAGNKPLLITEFGLDAATHGVEKQAAVMRWLHDSLLRGGAAGGVWFAYTDEWHRGGCDVTGWQFGIVDHERKERPACAVAGALGTRLAPPEDAPRISVIVCTRNGSATLHACLESLAALDYPGFDVLVIDDGSTDASAQIAQSFTHMRYCHQEHAGLSVARNLGAQLATGTILAYTDDDCIVHHDWLLHISHAFVETNVVAAGGPNIPPPPRNRVERVVAAAPGAPAHVLLNDIEAEHLPGCNLAIRKDALERIGGFRPGFRAAGDDVDVCWRLREAGGRLVFVPGAMVWHHRRFSVQAYLRQQSGYGHAEALLMKTHPSRFGPLGGARWRGGIYGDQLPADRPVEGSIFHGPFGLGAFQVIYASSSFRWWEHFTGVLWVALLLTALACGRLDLATGIGLFAIGAAWTVTTRNTMSLRGLADRLLLWMLGLSQPVVREWARLRGMIRLGARPTRHPLLPEIIPPEKPHKFTLQLGTLRFWSEKDTTRDFWLHELRQALKASHITHRQDDGWRWFDIEAWPRAEVSRAWLSVTEYHGQGRCLTRVRCMLRLRRGIGWNFLLWFIIAGLMMTTRHLLIIGIAGAIAALLLTPVALWLARREMKKQARDAAQAAGLVEML